MTLDELYPLLQERAGYQSERAKHRALIDGWKKSIAMEEQKLAYMDQKISDIEARIKL